MPGDNPVSGGAKGYRALLTGLIATAALAVAIPLVAALIPLSEGAGAFANLARAFGKPRFSGALGFTMMQASASAALALAIGFPAAFLLGRRNFRGRGLLAAAGAIPFCVPPLVVVIGFVLYYGREGVINAALRALGYRGEPLSMLYTTTGVVIVHAFYNFPVVMRVVGDAWERIPSGMADAATTLGAGRARAFFRVTLPLLAPSILASSSLVFLLCFFSFAIVLVFGGPGANTLETALFKAARFDLDMPLASALALAETATAFALLFVYGKASKRASRVLEDFAKPEPRRGFPDVGGRIAASCYLLFMIVFFAGPLFSILGASLTERSGFTGGTAFGLGNFASLFASKGFLPSLESTVGIGLASAFFSVCLGLSFSLALRHSRSTLLGQVLPLAPLAVSGIVVSYGYSVLLPTVPPLAIAFIQALGSYPFVLKSIQGAIGGADERFAEAARLLGSGEAGLLFRVRIPIAMPALLSGMAFSFAVSAGDANVILMSGSGVSTLALTLFRLSGSYRFGEACACAVIIMALTGFVFFLRETRNVGT